MTMIPMDRATCIGYRPGEVRLVLWLAKPPDIDLAHHVWIDEDSVSRDGPHWCVEESEIERLKRGTGGRFRRAEHPGQLALFGHE
jgi:hypothetical protein